MLWLNQQNNVRHKLLWTSLRLHGIRNVLEIVVLNIVCFHFSSIFIFLHSSINKNWICNYKIQFFGKNCTLNVFIWSRFKPAAVDFWSLIGLAWSKWVGCGLNCGLISAALMSERVSNSHTTQKIIYLYFWIHSIKRKLRKKMLVKYEFFKINFTDTKNKFCDFYDWGKFIGLWPSVVAVNENKNLWHAA